MDRPTAIKRVKRVLEVKSECLDMYDKEALKMALASLETDEVYQLEYENPNSVLTIPDNPTNGDMIRTMFPKWKIIEHELAFRIYPYGNDSAYFFFDKKWWDAPYKGVKGQTDETYTK